MSFITGFLTSILRPILKDLLFDLLGPFIKDLRAYHQLKPKFEEMGKEADDLIAMIEKAPNTPEGDAIYDSLVELKKFINNRNRV